MSGAARSASEDAALRPQTLFDQMLKDANDCPRGLLHQAHFRRFLDKPANFLNKPSVPIHNILLAALYQKSASWLLATSLLAFLACALPFALIFYFAACGDSDDADPADPPAPFWRVLTVAFSGLAGMDIGDDLSSATHCVLVIGLSEFVHILLEGTIFSIIVTKLMNPRIHFRFSAMAAVITRDGLPHLSFRLVHPQGHFCSDLDVIVTWIHRERTIEGETMGRMTAVSLNHWHKSIYMPQTFTHKIDERSPFFRYLQGGGRLSDAHGQLSVVVRARDEVLNADVWDGIIYNMCDVCHNGTHKWVDVLLPSETVSAIDPTKLTRAQRNRPIADLDKLDRLHHVT